MLVTVAFFGLAVSATRMLMQPLRGGQARAATVPPAQAAAAASGRPGRCRDAGRLRWLVSRGEPSAWMVVPVVAGVAALLCSACTRLRN